MSDSEQTQADLIRQIRKIFTEQIVFNKILQVELDLPNLDQACIRIPMQDEFVGNFIQHSLHGGVISAVLDVIGGLTAFVDLVKKMEGQANAEKLNRLSRFGTIDLRIDYLRPGRGKYFNATGSVLRTGNKVAVTRMELHNDEKSLIAVGTGTYLIS